MKRAAKNWYFVSGQVGVNPATKQASEHVEQQTEQTLQNMKAVLTEAGLGMQDIVKTTIFLTNMDDFAQINGIYMQHFPEPRPARSCVGVAALPDVANTKLLVEIEAVAYKESNS